MLSFILSMSIIFYGDSITKDWNSYNIINSDKITFIGKKGASSTYLADNINKIIEKKPEKIFLMMGINNIDTPNKIIEDYRRIFNNIIKKSPKTKIYVHSILPSRIESNNTINNTNKNIKTLCYEFNITYINIHDKLLDENNKLSKNFTKDGTHLNPNGYRLWKKLLIEGGYIVL